MAAPPVVRFAVGEAWTPHRIMVEQRDGYFSDRGWRHRLSFYARAAPHPDCAEWRVYEAHAPHRATIVPGDNADNAAARGWTYKLSFWAPSAPRLGCVPFAVGQAWEPHRAMLAQQDGAMDGAGWSHVLVFYAHPFDPSGAGAGGGYPLPTALAPLFASHCLTCSPGDALLPGRGMPYFEGGRLSVERQDAWYQLKSSLLTAMLPGFLEHLATAAPRDAYYVTGTQAINRALAVRGARTIPTDDIDVKFCPGPDLGALLRPLTAAWRGVADAVLASPAASAALAAVGLVVVRMDVLPAGIVNWAGIRVTVRNIAGAYLRDEELPSVLAPDDHEGYRYYGVGNAAHEARMASGGAAAAAAAGRPADGTFFWDLAQVGDMDWDHWDVAAHTVVDATCGVRFLTEEAAVGDLDVVWPRTATSKDTRRRLKADYWRWATGTPALPRCAGLKPPPPLQA